MNKTDARPRADMPAAAKIKRRLRREGELWAITIVMLIWLAIICYYPMYGLVIAFKQYKPGMDIWACQWVGLKYFNKFVTSNWFPKVMRNTLAISGLQMLFGFPAPILLAVLLNEVPVGQVQAHSADNFLPAALHIVGGRGFAYLLDT